MRLEEDDIVKIRCVLCIGEGTKMHSGSLLISLVRASNLPFRICAPVVVMFIESKGSLGGQKSNSTESQETPERNETDHK